MPVFTIGGLANALPKHHAKDKENKQIKIDLNKEDNLNMRETLEYKILLLHKPTTTPDYRTIMYFY